METIRETKKQKNKQGNGSPGPFGKETTMSTETTQTTQTPEAIQASEQTPTKAPRKRSKPAHPNVQMDPRELLKLAKAVSDAGGSMSDLVSKVRSLVKTEHQQFVDAALVSNRLAYIATKLKDRGVEVPRFGGRRERYNWDKIAEIVS